jgi:hypothetical protein
VKTEKTWRKRKGGTFLLHLDDRAQGGQEKYGKSLELSHTGWRSNKAVSREQIEHLDCARNVVQGSWKTRIT